jgi:replicative DNA helicase
MERAYQNEFDYYNRPSNEESYWRAVDSSLLLPDHRRSKSLADIKEAPEELFDFEREQWDVLNTFEEKAWSNDNTGFTMGFAGLDKALNKLQKGFHLVGGDSNIGKTSFLSQLSWNVATLNDDVYVLDFSLDDPMDVKLSRLIASGKQVLINAVAAPRDYKQYPKMLERRRDGLRQLRRMVDRYKSYDANHGTDVELIRETIKRHKVALIEAGENKRMAVFIDNFHDLTTTAKEAQQSEKAKYDYIAKYISKMADEYEIPIVCTAEFKKLNGYRRPVLDDIRESVKIKYAAKSIMLCYNEVSLKGESASVYFEKVGDNSKQPVYEVKVDKNKYTKFKGRVFFEGYPEMAYFVESDQDSTKRYNHAIYSNE